MIRRLRRVAFMGIAKMMKKMWVAAMMAAVGSSAMAAGGYVEASAGFSHVNQECPAGGNCKNNKPAFRLIGGFYHLNPMLVAEVGYLNFGKATAALAVNTQPSPVKGSLHSSALYAGLALRLPVDEDIGLTFRVGGANVRSQLVLSTGAKSEATRTNLLLGMGAEWRIEGNLSAMAAVDLTKTSDPNGGGRGSLSMVTAGVRYAF